MNNNCLYPFLLEPVIKDYIWGGNRLIKEFGFSSDTDTVAEAWVLSCHKNGTNTIKNGAFKGKKLDEVLKIWSKYQTQSYYFNTTVFPILIKLIDAKDKLSIQVHPDDIYALKHEGEFGKTEMWYVVDCEKDAELIYGFKNKISKSDFKERIKNNTLSDVLNYVPVKKGDVFFINSGTIHAIGKGILIAEVQQNSDTTYRVSDYGRVDKNGNLRELHIKQALDVTKTDITENDFEFTSKEYSYGTLKHLANCNYFDVKRLDFNGEMQLNTDKSFESLLVLNGNISVIYNNEEFTAKKGDSILIPAFFNTKISGCAELIISKLP